MPSPAGAAILAVELTAASRSRILPLCTLPILRADHVTLAHGVDVARFDPAWVPGGARLGERVPVHAVALLRSAEVEALAVELAGVRRRPHDGGLLHLTLSRSHAARSHAANALMSKRQGEACDLWLEGVVGWLRPRPAP